MDRKSYLGLLQDLLPPGPAWIRDMDALLTRILNVAAGELARVHARAINLLNEADPRTASEMLPDWERVCGLPDTCNATASTIQERRAAVHQKWTSRGGQSNQYWKEIADRLGYEIEITEFRPFICGASECGAGIFDGPYSKRSVGLTNDHDIRFYWSIKVLGPRVTWFQCGASECGIDPLAKISRAEDLECQIKRLMPAHTELIFAYEGGI